MRETTVVDGDTVAVNVTVEPAFGELGLNVRFTEKTLGATTSVISAIPVVPSVLLAVTVTVRFPAVV
tara:strand:- start:150 stop:350 length:201 start_codon:yes stop_codon:yes gene_type:complete